DLERLLILADLAFQVCLAEQRVGVELSLFELPEPGCSFTVQFACDVGLTAIDSQMRALGCNYVLQIVGSFVSASGDQLFGVFESRSRVFEIASAARQGSQCEQRPGNSERIAVKRVEVKRRFERRLRLIVAILNQGETPACQRESSRDVYVRYSRSNL